MSDADDDDGDSNSHQRSSSEPSDDAESVATASSDDADNEPKGRQRRRGSKTKEPVVGGRGGDDDESSSSSSEDDESISESSEDSNDARFRGHDNDDDDDNLPVSLKLERQLHAGVDLRPSRQRKLEARRIVSERLSLERNRKIENNKEKETSNNNRKKKMKKKSKHAPTEVSSKRSDFYKRRPNLNESGIGVAIAPGYKPRDPRQSNLSGHLDMDHFEHNYAFLEEIRAKEIVNLKQKIQSHKTTGKKGQHMRRRLGITQEHSLQEDQAQLKRLVQEKSDFERQQIDRAAKKAVKNKLMQDEAAGGKRPFYLKRSKQKQLVLEAKYEEIRKRKGEKAVEKVVAKRLKRSRKHLPV